MSATRIGASKKSKLSIMLTVLGWMVPLTGFLLAGWAWAWSSPIGSAPDDDYHMASIWCPTPLEQSGCIVGYQDDGTPVIEVPELISAGVCWVFDSEKSAGCQYGMSGTTRTSRVDNGQYPGGYYDFMHLFVGSSVPRSVYAMRMLNVGLAAILGAATLAVTRRSARLPLVSGAAIALVPLGIFLISSLNPSSWAITGVIVAWAATHALISGTRGAKRIIAILLLLVGAALAATSRSDAAAYIVVVTLGYLVFQFRRTIPWTSVGAVFVAGAIGVTGFLSGGQSSVLTNPWSDPTSELPAMLLFALNLRDLPSLFGGMFGYEWGLGWLDTIPLSITAVGMLTVVGGVFFLGTQKLSWRKGLILLMLIGGAASLALYTLQMNGVQVGYQVQPRYMLPLVIVFVMVLFIDPYCPERSIRLSGCTRGMVWLIVVIAHCFALQRNIRRYTTGVDVDRFDLNYAVEWWVAPISPTALWLIGTFGFAVFAAAVLYVGRVAVPAPRVVAE